jgi:hypothetical protein
MNSNFVRRTLLATSIALSLGLVACSETPRETAEDVAKAKQDAATELNQAKVDANKDVAVARQDLRETVREGAQDMQAASNDRNEALADANADMRDTAKEVAQDINAQGADLTREQAAANHQVAMTKADGEYKIENERCDGMTGAAKDACQASAKATYEQRKMDADAQLKRYQDLADANEKKAG